MINSMPGSRYVHIYLVKSGIFEFTQTQTDSCEHEPVNTDVPPTVRLAIEGAPLMAEEAVREGDGSAEEPRVVEEDDVVVEEDDGLVDDENEGNPPQLLSFSYTDIITKDIRMKLC